MEDIAKFERIMSDGFEDVECPECGEFSRVEPDADYPCPECNEGRLQSSLIIEGLI